MFEENVLLKDTKNVSTKEFYKINCLGREFVYHSQSGRAVKTKIMEYQKAVCTFPLRAKSPVFHGRLVCC